MPIAAEIAIAQVVGQQDHDVGWLLILTGLSRRTDRESENESEHEALHDYSLGPHKVFPLLKLPLSNELFEVAILEWVSSFILILVWHRGFFTDFLARADDHRVS